jgi:hypothetical protein
MSKGKSSCPVKEVEYIDVLYNKPYAMIEGLTKTSTRKMVKALVGIIHHYEEHNELSHVKTLLQTHEEICHQMTRKEKEVFACFASIIRETNGAQVTEDSILELFPHFREVLDFDPRAGSSNYCYVHREKKTEWNEDGIGDSSIRGTRYIDISKRSRAVYERIKSSSMW